MGEKLLMGSLRTVAVLGGLVATAAFGLAPSLAQPAADGAAPHTVWQGVYTEEQAARGAEAYLNNCAGCHGTDLRAVDSNAPDLRGPTYRFKWHGKTVGERFQTIKDTMPPFAPGSLSDQQYIDIIAHIFSVNEYPTGEGELMPEFAALEQIAIVPKPQ